MRKKEQRYASVIVPISPLKAFLGFAADFFLSFGLMMISIFFIAPLLQSAWGYDEALSNLGQAAKDSHLYSVNVTSSAVEPHLYLYGSDYSKKINSEGKIAEAYDEVDEPFIGHYPFELYEGIVFDYYMDFSYEGRGSFVSLEGKILPEMKEKSKEEVGRYIGETFFKIEEGSIYTFQKDEGGNPRYDLRPVLNEENATVQGLRGDKPLSSATAINDFFLSNSSGAYVNAIKAFLTVEPLYQQYYAEAEHIIFLAKIPTRLVPPLIFLFIIPMILRDGKSLGRLLTFSAVIDKRGYSAHKGRIAIHQGVLYLPWLLALLPFDVLALFTVVILYLGDFLVYNLSKNKRSLHEMIAGTLTVNDVDSSYFSSKKDLEDYLKDHPNAMDEETILEESVYEEVVSKPIEKPEPVPEAKEKAPDEASKAELDEDDYLDGK